MRNFMVFFSLQFIAYLNITISMRASAHGVMWAAMIAMGIAPLIAWSIIEHIQEAHHSWEGRVGVALGGASAAGVGILLTRTWG